MLYSFSIDSNIIYLTKGLSSDISGVFDIAKCYIFSYFLDYDGNVLKLDCRSLFQTSSYIAKSKWKSLEDLVIGTMEAEFKPAQ